VEGAAGVANGQDLFGRFGLKPGIESGFRVGNGLGLVEVVVDDVADDFLSGDFCFDLGHLPEGFEGGVHEVGEGRDLGVVDGVAGEGVGDGVEVGHDAVVVVHVLEGDDGGEGEVVRDGGFDAEDFFAVAVAVAEVFAAEGGHGAAGSGVGEVAAARVVGGASGAG